MRPIDDVLIFAFVSEITNLSNGMTIFRSASLIFGNVSLILWTILLFFGG